MRLFYILTLLFIIPTLGFTQAIPIRFDNLARSFPFEAKVYDSSPSFVESKEGAIWVSWHVFLAEENTEMVLVRPIKNGNPGLTLEVTPGPGVYSEPELVLSNDGTIWVFWSENKNDKWSLYTRNIEGGELGDIIQLSSNHNKAALKPHALEVEDGLFVSWATYKDGKFQIVYRKYTQGNWGAPKSASDPAVHSFRPSLSEDNEGNVWVFWDSYKDGNSVINGRKLFPETDDIVRLSGSGDRYYNAVSSYSERSGLCVAWVKVVDVIGGHGAIDQQYSFEMVSLQGDKWKLIKDSSGDGSAALITRGLLAKVEPEHEPTGGYLGQRLLPMFLESEGYLWLLWERKSKQSGSTFLIKGDLIGRRFNGTIWEEPKLLTHGHVDYRIANNAKTHNGDFSIVASDLPEYGTQDYKYFTHSLNDFKEYEQEKWTGWKPVSLPMEEDKVVQSHKIMDGGKSYHLYWMDSHVHSDLSTDAEGPIDQVIFYGRDRAKIDAIVSQENDYFLTPLTNYDYYLGKFFSDVLTDNNYLVMHGFEWTSRLPSNDKIKSTSPISWGRNFPDHRTVIYPRSGGPLIRFTDVNNDIRELNSKVQDFGGVTIAQHPTFKLNNDPVEVAVEAASGWGTYLSKPKFIHSNLDSGYKFGFAGVTDSHRRNPGMNGGLTGIYAESLTSDDILEAYKSKRFYATNGSKIILDARANGYFMGKEFETENEVELSLQVKSPKPIKTVVLLRNGEEITRINSGNQSNNSFKYIDKDLNKGKYWYYWRVEIEGYSTHYGGNVMIAKGNLAWSTPHWVTIN